MKKLILSALMLTALSAPTLTHPIALQTAFDMGMFLTNLVMTPEILKSWGAPVPPIFIRTKLLKVPHKNTPTYKKSYPLTIAHLGLYMYTVRGLWKAYKERKNTGTIQVKR